MKIGLVLLTILPQGIWAANYKMGLNQQWPNSQKFMNYMVGFFQESAGNTYEECNYFPSLRSFSNNRDISIFSKILNSWMCDSPFTKELAKVASGFNLLTRAFLNAFEGNRLEELTSSTTEVTTTTPEVTTTTPRIETQTVLYVGNRYSNPEISVYVWSSTKKNLEKRTSVAINSDSNCLITDKTRNLLISLDNGEEVKQQLEVFDLKGGMDKPQLLKSTESDNTNFEYAAVDSSGKYLMLTDYYKNYVYAMEIMADGSLSSDITLTQPTVNGLHPYFIKFHPKATDVLLVIYFSENVGKVIFYRFDSAKVSLEPVSTKEEVNSVARISFNDDGQYMYVLTTSSELVTIKITVDVVKNDVTNLEEQDRFNAVDSSSNFIATSNMVVTPSSKFLYIMTSKEVVIFAINPSTGKPSPGGSYSFGGSNGNKMVISPDGTNLVVSHFEKGIVVLGIKEDGQLEQLSEFEYTNAPNVLFYTWMHQQQ